MEGFFQDPALTVALAVAAGMVAHVAARHLMHWPWDLAVPFGALMVVTGPTVVQPVLRRVPVRPNLATILEGKFEPLPLVLIRNEHAGLVTDRLEFRPGDEVYFVWPYAAGPRTGRWLSLRGWKPVS